MLQNYEAEQRSRRDLQTQYVLFVTIKANRPATAIHKINEILR